jgi:lipopolysaccharide transport system permease protein
VGISCRLSHRLDLVLHLVRRDFQLRYHDSSLGVLWALVLPLAQLFVLVFLFQKIVPLSIEDYPAFLFSALLPWAWFSTSLGDAGNLFLANRDLLRQAHFAPATLVVVNTLSRLLLYLVSLPILLAVLALYGRPLTSASLLLPILIVIQGTLSVGLGLLVATLNVFYRDVQHIVGVLVALLFYLTPVFYRPDRLNGSFELFFTLNPLAVLIESYRAIFFHGTVPAPAALGLAAAASIVVGLLGYHVYRQQRHAIVESV